MTISTNAQRITRIYRGSTKVYEDSGFDVIPVELNSKYMYGIMFIILGQNVIYLAGSFGVSQEPPSASTVIGTFKTGKKITGKTVFYSSVAGIVEVANNSITMSGKYTTGSSWGGVQELLKS